LAVLLAWLDYFDIEMMAYFAGLILLAGQFLPIMP
jgi:hypothetical protein